MYIGNAYYSSGEFEQAVLEFDYLLQTYPNTGQNAEALYQKGLAHAQLGESTNARRAFERVVAEYPESREASMAQDRLLEADSR